REHETWGSSWLRLKPRKTPHRGSSTWQKPSLLPWAISLKQEPAEELLQINATLRRNLQPLGWGGCQFLDNRLGLILCCLGRLGLLQGRRQAWLQPCQALAAVIFTEAWGFLDGAAGEQIRIIAMLHAIEGFGCLHAQAVLGKGLALVDQAPHSSNRAIVGWQFG